MKGVLKFSAHNPNARASQNYSIVKDLGQTPCVMSPLEVLQTCPSQRNAFLSMLGYLVLQNNSPADRWIFHWSTDPSTKTKNYLWTLPFLYINYSHRKREKEG
jgi:hypothetical protein